MPPSRSAYARRRPTAPLIARELKRRMKYVDSKREGPHTFNRTDLVPLIAFGVELASKYLLSKEFICGILMSYSGLYGDVGVQLFLKQRPTWIVNAMTLSAEALYDA